MTRRLVWLMLMLMPAAALADGSWTLEFGPYAGHYDFDNLTAFRDRALFGLRGGVQLNRWATLEAEFDEVYTRRAVSGHRARQVTFGFHARFEPLDGNWSPSILAGPAFVIFDDQSDPDAYGEAWDVGLGARYHVGERWTLRAEWMLRRHEMTLVDQHVEEGELVRDRQNLVLWGRSLRLGVMRVF